MLISLPQTLQCPRNMNHECHKTLHITLPYKCLRTQIFFQAFLYVNFFHTVDFSKTSWFQIACSISYSLCSKQSVMSLTCIAHKISLLNILFFHFVAWSLQILENFWTFHKHVVFLLHMQLTCKISCKWRRQWWIFLQLQTTSFCQLMPWRTCYLRNKYLIQMIFIDENGMTNSSSVKV